MVVRVGAARVRHLLGRQGKDEQGEQHDDDLQPGPLGGNAVQRNRIRRVLRDNASPRHVPAKILQVSDIPRTRSGKLSELAVRNAVEGRAVDNTEALLNPEVLEQFRGRPELATD